MRTALLRIFAIGASAALVVTALASPAEATPRPTPDYGLTGACNMTNPNAAFGMFTIWLPGQP